MRDLWKGIVGIPGTWDPDDAAIQRWRDDLVNIECSDEYIDISDAFRGVIKRMKSWRAPGPDCIQAYWWKVFPRASNLLMGLSTRVVNGELEVPQWVVTGQTVLIPKTKEASRPEHYRPIACLNTIYKIITAVMERVLRDHVTKHNILPPEQFALQKGRGGCLDALMIDSMVVEDVTMRSRSLDVAWIDYQKAFDMVPHGWLQEVLKLCKIPDQLQKTINDLMRKWSTVFMLRHAGGMLRTTEVQYKRGIFQGDTLSPLLFCLCVTPISYGLRTTSGYTARFLKEPVTHLMFVDDLKIYASGGAAMGRSLKEVERMINSIDMKIGASKCATASIRRGKVTRAADHSFGNALIKALSVGKSYTYLGITQVFRAEEREVRESLRKVYFDRLNRIWKAPLSARNKIHASNVWAISLFRYFFSSPMKWTKTYLKQLDTATRRILRKHKGHYRGGLS